MPLEVQPATLRAWQTLLHSLTSDARSLGQSGRTLATSRLHIDGRCVRVDDSFGLQPRQTALRGHMQPNTARKPCLQFSESLVVLGLRIALASVAADVSRSLLRVQRRSVRNADPSHRQSAVETFEEVAPMLRVVRTKKKLERAPTIPSLHEPYAHIVAFKVPCSFFPVIVFAAENRSPALSAAGQGRRKCSS